MAFGLPQLRWLMKATSNLSSASTLARATRGLRAPAMTLGRTGLSAGRALKQGWAPIRAAGMGSLSIPKLRAALPAHIGGVGMRAGRIVGSGLKEAVRVTSTPSRYLLAGGAGIAAGSAVGARRRYRQLRQPRIY